MAKCTIFRKSMWNFDFPFVVAPLMVLRAPPGTRVSPSHPRGRVDRDPRIKIASVDRDSIFVAREGPKERSGKKKKKKKILRGRDDVPRSPRDTPVSRRERCSDFIGTRYRDRRVSLYNVLSLLRNTRRRITASCRVLVKRGKKTKRKKKGEKPCRGPDAILPCTLVTVLATLI